MFHLWCSCHVSTCVWHVVLINWWWWWWCDRQSNVRRQQTDVRRASSLNAPTLGVEAYNKVQYRETGHFIRAAGHVCRALHYLLCLRPHRVEALSDAFICRLTVCLMSDVSLSDICLSRTSGLTREQRGLGRLNWHRGSPRHTWLGHHFQGQKAKCQLVAMS